MRQQWCLLFFTKNAFLELITNLTFMENLKKKAKKWRRGPLENLCHTKNADYILEMPGLGLFSDGYTSKYGFTNKCRKFF